MEFQCPWGSLACLSKRLVKACPCEDASSEPESWSMSAHSCYMTRAWHSLWWLKQLKLPECFSHTKILLTLAFGRHQFFLYVVLVSPKGTPVKMSGSSCWRLSNTHTSPPPICQPLPRLSQLPISWHTFLNFPFCHSGTHLKQVSSSFPPALSSGSTCFKTSEKYFVYVVTFCWL